ncbi:hypothetical protein [Sinomonas flava]|uniref:hypothetical protein n=1 Tax=Sinomonas flava TaxID=496857 RepID=UPI0039A65E53
MSEERLRIELEDAASASWWARILYTLSSQYGSTQLRFVGKSDDGSTLYRGETFPGPPLNRTPPREGWAPGMEECLRRLRSEIDGDGWVETGRGEQPWQISYTRPAAPA